VFDIFVLWVGFSGVFGGVVIVCLIFLRCFCWVFPLFIYVLLVTVFLSTLEFNVYGSFTFYSTIYIKHPLHELRMKGTCI
jgi:hypothetical protein